MPSVILHGGAGSPVDDSQRKSSIRQSLQEIRSHIWEMLQSGASARDSAVSGCKRLESDPEFNAGRGSKIQADGRIRMSASLMDGDSRTFTGVIHAERLHHPIQLADALQSERDRLLAPPGLDTLARDLDMPVSDPTTLGQLEKWYAKRREEMTSETQDPSDGEDAAGGLEHDHHGTVGVAVLDNDGRLAVATSTGGRGYEQPGRVSDSSIPAGNYATDRVAISCTGVGEHIIDEALAPRIAVRIDDGASLPDAFRKTFREADDRERSFGAIGLHADGHVTWGKTTGTLLAAWRTPRQTGHALDAPVDPTVETPSH